MEYILKELPSLVLYFTSGYVFIKIYGCIRSVVKQKDWEHLFLRCVVFGYIYKNILCVIPYRSSKEYINVIGLIVFSAFIGIIAGVILNSNLFDKLLCKMNFRRTASEYFWDDLDDKKKTVWIHASNYQLNIEYFGILVLIEDHPRYPLIVLSNYLKRYNSSGETIEDCYLDCSKRVLIDTEKYDIIEFVYENDSPVIREMQEKFNEQNTYDEAAATEQ